MPSSLTAGMKKRLRFMTLATRFKTVIAIGGVDVCPKLKVEA
jgi:hypothetical protein